MKRLLLAAVVFPFATFVSAQSLTPEELTALIDKRVKALNPYQNLLNDPDPDRSLAAMQIMMESGDKDLMRMALEFGLLSPNLSVKRIAFETWLSSGPVMSFRFDGTDIKDRHYSNTVRSSWNGTIDGTTGYWRIQVGKRIEEKRCYANTYDIDKCFITVNSDGVFLTPRSFNARGALTDDGRLDGVGSMYNVDEPVPFSVQLID